MDLSEALTSCLDLHHRYIHVNGGGDYYIERCGKTLKIYFEWSDGIEDWINNFRFFAVPCKPYKGMNKIWFCHGGFFKVWEAIEPYLAEVIADRSITNIDVVGYSHGAAIALLCYEYCVFNRPDAIIEGVGFGCPRVLWGFIPKKIRERFYNFKVVRNGNDIVCHLPPAFMGFTHVGKIIKIGRTNPIKDHLGSEYLQSIKKFYCQ